MPHMLSTLWYRQMAVNRMQKQKHMKYGYIVKKHQNSQDNEQKDKKKDNISRTRILGAYSGMKTSLL